jgi:hypothetical protein
MNKEGAARIRIVERRWRKFFWMTVCLVSSKVVFLSESSSVIVALRVWTPIWPNVLSSAMFADIMLKGNLLRQVLYLLA